MRSTTSYWRQYHDWYWFIQRIYQLVTTAGLQQRTAKSVTVAFSWNRFYRNRRSRSYRTKLKLTFTRLIKRDNYENWRSWYYSTTGFPSKSSFIVGDQRRWTTDQLKQHIISKPVNRARVFAEETMGDYRNLELGPSVWWVRCRRIQVWRHKRRIKATGKSVRKTCRHGSDR